MIYSDVRAAVRNAALGALKDFTNPVVIFSNNNGSEPSESYVVVNILSIEQQGHVSKSTLTTVGNELIFQVAYEIQVQFSFIGSLSGDMVQSFTQNINNNPISTEESKRQKLGFMRKSQVRRAPQKRDTKWVEYHNTDVTFSYVIITSQPVDIVTGVVIQENISNNTETIKFPDSIVYP